jgi:hypothetical protein
MGGLGDFITIHFITNLDAYLATESRLIFYWSVGNLS